MGDLPPGSRPQALDIAATGLARDATQNIAFPSSSPYKSSGSTSPFQSQLSTLPYGHNRPDPRSLPQTTGHYAQQQDLGASALNMGAMSGSLPSYGAPDDTLLNPHGQAVTRSLSGASTSAVVYQLGHNLQAPLHSSGAVPNHASYGSGYGYQQPLVPSPGPLHSGYTQYLNNQPRLPGQSMQASYQNFPQSPQYMYYSNPYASAGQYAPSYLPPSGPAHAMYGRRSSLSSAQSGAPGQIADSLNLDNSFVNARAIPGSQNIEAGGNAAPFASSAQGQGLPRAQPVNSIPRGPPRKPKQSGHALWVGNLPPGTTVVALKDHFSREATKDIESLFLISKSNCAFVNYRSESSCTAAMHRFHDSRFNGVRLVCRLRRSSTAASGIPTGPSAMAGSQTIGTSPPSSPKGATKPLDTLLGEPPVSPIHKEGDSTTAETVQAVNKYFIVKSLTLQDLDLSVRNGIWATQSHNEGVLNKAYSSAENVYLIFSANKSGEYFGYARMASQILDDGASLADAVPKLESPAITSDAPKSIPTAASEWAPKGRIIDDSARGTIFWEADHDDSEGDENKHEKTVLPSDVEAPTVAQSWGKPFKIEWISTNRLPFYRTRGLRNPWNANREVKIARDGTELEPSVGERLVQMFHRLGPSGTAAPPYPQHNQFGGPGVGAMRSY